MDFTSRWQCKSVSMVGAVPYLSHWFTIAWTADSPEYCIIVFVIMFFVFR